MVGLAEEEEDEKGALAALADNHLLLRLGGVKRERHCQPLNDLLHVLQL